MQIYDQADRDPITFDWNERLGARVLQSVDHAVPSPLVRVEQGMDANAGTSYVVIDASAARHGGQYMIEVTATCINGNVLNWQYPLPIGNY